MLKHEKPHQCEKCGSDHVAVILYGLPSLSEELEREIDAGHVVLGGCCRTPDSPEWFCMACHHKWRGGLRYEFTPDSKVDNSVGMATATVTENISSPLKEVMNDANISLGRWIQSHYLISFAIVLMAALAWAASDTHPTNSILYTQDRAIERGRTFSLYILNGEVAQLVPAAYSTAARKLKDSPPASFHDVTREQFLSLPSSAISPLFAVFTPPDARMQLYKLNRREDDFVMTFAALRGYKDGYIGADGHPLVVSVAVRYVEAQPKGLLAEWRNRLTNFSWLPNSVRTSVSGDWYLIDYEYSYNLRDYYGWVRRNEQRLHEKLIQEQKEPLVLPNLAELNERVSKMDASQQRWSALTCATQLSEVMAQLPLEEVAGY